MGGSPRSRACLEHRPPTGSRPPPPQPSSKEPTSKSGATPVLGKLKHRIVEEFVQTTHISNRAGPGPQNAQPPVLALIPQGRGQAVSPPFLPLQVGAMQPLSLTVLRAKGAPRCPSNPKCFLSPPRPSAPPHKSVLGLPGAWREDWVPSRGPCPARTRPPTPGAEMAAQMQLGGGGGAVALPSSLMASAVQLVDRRVDTGRRGAGWSQRCRGYLSSPWRSPSLAGCSGNAPSSGHRASLDLWGDPTPSYLPGTPVCLFLLGPPRTGLKA